MKVRNWIRTTAKNISEQRPALDLFIIYENIHMIDWRAADECSALSEQSGCFEPCENIYLLLVIQHQRTEHPKRCLREDPQSHNKRHPSLGNQPSVCVCSRSRALGQETSSLSLRPLRRTKTPGATSLCWHPKGRPMPSTDPHTAAAKPHLDCYIWLHISEAINDTHHHNSISNTHMKSWISSCDKVQVLSDML